MIDYSQHKDEIPKRIILSEEQFGRNLVAMSTHPKAPHAMPHTQESRQRISEAMKRRHTKQKMIERVIDATDPKVYQEWYEELQRQINHNLKQLDSCFKEVAYVSKKLGGKEDMTMRQIARKVMREYIDQCATKITKEKNNETNDRG